MRSLVVAAALGVCALAFAMPARAAGCASGGAVGAAAGYLAGHHAAFGSGCSAGHHHAETVARHERHQQQNGNDLNRASGNTGPQN